MCNFQKSLFKVCLKGYCNGIEDLNEVEGMDSLKNDLFQDSNASLTKVVGVVTFASLRVCVGEDQSLSMSTCSANLLSTE